MNLTDLFQELTLYFKENFIKYSVQMSDKDYLITLQGKIYQLFLPNEEGVYFDEKFCWDCDRTEYDGYIFKFGGVWYTLKSGDEMSPKLNRVKWIGEVDIEGYEDFLPGYFLGVHGPFELLNGTGSYKDWCKKAKFLKIKKLGICEKGTLAGVFKFQSACKKENITPIFGMEIPIKDEKHDVLYTIKAFVKDEQGWLNLLKINKLINVDNTGFLSEENYIENRKGLVTIIDPKTIDFDNLSISWRTMFAHQFYYQFDTVIYEKEDRDEWYLKNLQKFFRSKIKPIAMCDAYYLDKEYSILRTLLNRVSGKVSYESNNQYFKNNYEYFEECIKLFKANDDKSFDTYSEAMENLIEVCESCNYSIQTDTRHLPRYSMTEEEKKLYSNNIEMFEELVYKGLENHTELFDDYDDEVIGERIQKEIEVIEYGDVVDYFLVLRDIVNWCNEHNILLGAGRGSAAGSLVTYLLGITKVNPLKYNLLFERFLNKGRLYRETSKEIIKLTGTDNLDIELDSNAKCVIFRSNKKITVYARDLQEDDELISYK